MTVSIDIPLEKPITKRSGHMSVPEANSASLSRLVDLIVLIWIGWFAWRHAGFLLRDDLYLYGDHPGQFYRLWQLLAFAWSEEGRLISWSPYWHGGRPELQFYPPGFAILGWLIWLASFQQLPLFSVYQTLVFASFILPAISIYLLMTWGLGDRLAGFMAAWFMMTFPFPLGGVQGVIIGLVGYQLAFGLIPILILAGLWLMSSEDKRLPWLITGLILAAMMLLHPLQVILPVAILGLAALLRGKGWQTHFHWLILTVLLSFGLTAFWWLPLGTQLQFFVPHIEASLQDILTHFENMWALEMLVLLAAALIGSFFRPAYRRSVSLGILIAGVGLFGFIFFDALVLVERFSLYILDPVRLIAGVSLALLAGLAIGVSELAWAGVRILRPWRKGFLGLPLLIIIPWLVYTHYLEEYDFSKWMSKWQPGLNRTPFFLREAEAKYGLSEVWQVMADTPGRVLFTSHYGLLYDVPTSLKAVTPFLTGREIVGGTFTLPSPVASYLWTGQLGPPLLRGKVEATDDKTLAGVSWAAMDDGFLLNLARHFNVTLIVTTATDRQARSFLDHSDHFDVSWSNNLFTLYTIAGYEPSWAEAEGASATVSRYDRTAIDVQIAEASAGAHLLVKVANFPRWQAEAEGQLLPIETDGFGLMNLALPPGSYTVHLRYKPSWPERLGGMISWATLLLAVGSVVYWLFPKLAKKEP
jgi:hypothetical protein